MIKLNRQQRAAVATILAEATTAQEVRIEEITSETMKGSVAVSVTYPGTKNDVVTLVGTNGATARLT